VDAMDVNAQIITGSIIFSDPCFKLATHPLIKFLRAIIVSGAARPNDQHFSVSLS
jgi:hypothetical protein